MERQLGIILFLPPAAVGQAPTIPSFDPSEGGFDLAAVWAAIQAISGPSIDSLEPILPTIKVNPSAEALAAKAKIREKRRDIWLARAGIVGATSALIAVVPNLTLAWLLCLWGGFAIAKEHMKASSSLFRAFEKRYVNAEQNFQRSKRTWRARLDPGFSFEKLKEELKGARSCYLSLPVAQQERMVAFEQSRRRQHLRDFLDTFEISREKFAGIGPARRKTLVSYGVETAADCTEEKLYAIPGFGPALCGPLIEWRKGRERRFVYNPSLTPADTAALSKIKSDIRAEAHRLRQQLAVGASDLGRRAASIRARAAQMDSSVVASYREKLQAETDLRELVIELPDVDPVPP
jgi:DNA-binding helix-hairpin-helix protein with protein kinase domain